MFVWFKDNFNYALAMGQRLFMDALSQMPYVILCKIYHRFHALLKINGKMSLAWWIKPTVATIIKNDLNEP